MTFQIQMCYNFTRPPVWQSCRDLFFLGGAGVYHYKNNTLKIKSGKKSHLKQEFTLNSFLLVGDTSQ